MRVLTLNRGRSRLNLSIEPILEQRGVEFHHIALDEVQRPSGSKISQKLQSYFSRQAIGSIRAAVDEFRPDLVHVMAGRSTALLAVQALRSRPDIPIVLYHGAIGGLNVASPIEWATYFNSRIAKIAVPSHALVNNWLGRPLLGKLIGADRLSVLPHPVEVPERLDNAERAKLRAAFGLKPDDIVIGSVCSIRPVKNLEFLARVVRDIGSPYKLLIIGGGGAGEIEALEEIGGDSIDVAGFRPGAAKLMPIFDIYATPTRPAGESFGLAPAEAMAAGVPVLTMNYGGTAEIVEHGASGFSLTADPADWAASIVQLQDPDVRRRMGEAARERIQQRFSPEIIADVCEELYRLVSARNAVHT